MTTDKDITHNPGMENYHESVHKKLDYFFASKEIPHIIFHGSSGTGKRTILHNFLYKIYDGDKHKLKTNVMSVNCAHGKGIKFIRDDLKNFAKTNVQSNSGILFKSIVLYNADYLTIDAQSALRRCIEIFSHNTRFFIVVENKQKLFNPILSRFCEIYVPEVFIDGKFTNLHTMKMNSNKYSYSNTTYLSTDVRYEREENEIIKLHGICRIYPEVFNEKLVDAVSQFYERGRSAQDIVSCIENLSIFSKNEKIIIVLCFNKIRSEFRNEKMLMFYILDFALLRLETSVKHISFI
jgi:DNA polymerase III delta prime subunit